MSNETLPLHTGAYAKGTREWVEEYEDFIKKLKTEKGHRVLQEMLNGVNWNFLSHNTSGDNSLFITVGKAFELAFGVRTQIKGQFAEEVEKRLSESRVPLAVATYIDGKSGKKNTARAILRRHLPDFADAVYPMASERYLPDDGTPIALPKPVDREHQQFVIKRSGRQFYVGSRGRFEKRTVLWYKV